MARKPLFSIAGTVPEEHGLETIRQHLLENPRDRVFAVVELVNLADTRNHPAEDASYRTITVMFVDLEPVVVPDDVNTVREVRDRARLNRPGQGTLGSSETEDELSARRSGGQTDTGGRQ